MLAYDFSVNPTFWCMAVTDKTKNILFLLLTSKKIAEALGEQQAATIDCISSLRYLKIICPAFFPQCGPESVWMCVCVCVCVHVHKHIPWPAFPIGSTKARSVGWCDFPWDAAGWDQHDCLQTSFFCVKSAWNFDWKRLFFLTLPPLSYIRLLATVLLGSFKVMKWWVEQRRK